MLRSPFVAGRFYPARPEILREDIEKYAIRAAEPVRAVGCVVPHAGYMFSGPVAGAVYGSLELPASFVILGPNHTGRGKSLAACTSGEWLTPLGRVPVDTALAAGIVRECPEVSDDSAAHAEEHSLEVQLPFLQHLSPGFSFAPIVIGTGAVPVLQKLGEGLARAIHASGKPVLIVASSDMNHYEPDSPTRIKDREAIERILALDGAGLYEVLRRTNSTMCGYGPVIAMLSAAKALGATKSALVRYATSADAGGPREQVVGYAGIAVY